MGCKVGKYWPYLLNTLSGGRLCVQDMLCRHLGDPDFKDFARDKSLKGVISFDGLENLSFEIGENSQRIYKELVGMCECRTFTAITFLTGLDKAKKEADLPKCGISEILFLPSHNSSSCCRVSRPERSLTLLPPNSSTFKFVSRSNPYVTEACKSD